MFWEWVMWDSGKPYNDLPLLPPDVEVETKAVLKACIAARSAVAELKGVAELIPNQSMLIGILPLLEARASSEIEHIVTTTDQLFRHREDSGGADEATKEALRYGEALMGGFQSLSKRPLNTRTAEEVCTIIKGVSMRVRGLPGTALASESGKVVYTPPEGEERLRGLLANWERFMHDEQQLDPLIRMAVGHYQFEAIHPFLDGNGRTGRVLNSLFLIQEGLLKLPILYLSRHILRNRADYYRLLREVTSANSWEPWILYILQGVAETAIWTVAKIEGIQALHSATAEYVRDARPKIYRRELVDLIFELPYCRIPKVIERGIARRDTASRYLKELTEIGVLREIVAGREKLFLHPRLMELLSSDDNSFRPLGVRE